MVSNVFVIKAGEYSIFLLFLKIEPLLPKVIENFSLTHYFLNIQLSFLALFQYLFFCRLGIQKN